MWCWGLKNILQTCLNRIQFTEYNVIVYKDPSTNLKCKFEAWKLVLGYKNDSVAGDVIMWNIYIHILSHPETPLRLSHNDHINPLTNGQSNGQLGKFQFTPYHEV